MKGTTLQGTKAIVTGAASGIGLACAQALLDHDAEVLALDLDPSVERIVDAKRWSGVVCDVSDPESVSSAISGYVDRMGPVDHLVSNAGFFSAGAEIAVLPLDVWNRSMAVNLTGHLLVLQATIPRMNDGGGIVIMGSRNVPAPGPGAAAYSCAKAAATQLARVAALELAPRRIRVNVIHPDSVFDTDLWTAEALERSASRYGMTVQEYKSKNLMKVEISRTHVADGVCAVLSPAFGRTTGAQIPIDGGNDRVI